MASYTDRQLMNAIADACYLERDKISRHDHLVNTHNRDSLEGMDMVLGLQDQFNISITDDEIWEVCGSRSASDATVGQWVDFLKTKLPQ